MLLQCPQLRQLRKWNRDAAETNLGKMTPGRAVTRFQLTFLFIIFLMLLSCSVRTPAQRVMVPETLEFGGFPTVGHIQKLNIDNGSLDSSFDSLASPSSPRHDFSPPFCRREGSDDAFLEGGHNLRSFTLCFWFKPPLERCSAPHNTHWFDGCSLVTSVPGARPTHRWKAASREFRLRVSRNDFGVSLSRNGTISFGIGSRCAIPRGALGIPQYTDAGCGDHTLHSTAPLREGRWHHVCAERNASAANGLALYINGVRTDCRLGGVCVGETVNQGRLDDALFRLPLAKGLDAGCMQGVELHSKFSAEFSVLPRAREEAMSDDSIGVLGTAGVLRRMKETATRSALRSMALYYYYSPGSGSETLRSNFLAALEQTGDPLVLHGIATEQDVGRERRFTFKLDMILTALSEQAQGSIICIADMDVIVARPFVRTIHVYMDAPGRSLDILFQRNDDDGLEVNIGFMALRVNERVSRFWSRVRAFLLGNRAPGQRIRSDQSIVNEFLFLHAAKMANLRWGFFPPEFATQTFLLRRNVQGNQMYESFSVDLYHANKGGQFESEKALRIKQQELERVRLRLTPTPPPPDSDVGAGATPA